MSGSWHDFIFGAFDPAGTITLDKLPGAFWLQALSVRAFGYSTWAIVLPQVVEGVLTVLVLYRAVSRLAGPAAGLIAAFVLAASPGGGRAGPGEHLRLADDLAAGAGGRRRLGRHRPRRPWWRLILAGVCVGLAFQAKMIEAWLVLPALGLAYLISGPGPTWRRVRQLVAAGVVTAVVSLVVDDGRLAGARRQQALRRRQSRQLPLPAGVRLQRVRPLRRADPAAATHRRARAERVRARAVLGRRPARPGCWRTNSAGIPAGCCPPPP